MEVLKEYEHFEADVSDEKATRKIFSGINKITRET